MNSYYLDYPGIGDDDPRLPLDRLVGTYREAVQRAIEVYQTRLDVGKVVICSGENLARVATVYGDRSNPRVVRRRTIRPGGAPPT